MPNSDLVSSPRFPHPHSIVRNGRGNQSSARMKSSMIDRAKTNLRDAPWLSEQRCDWQACCDVPNACRAISVGRGHTLTIGTELSVRHVFSRIGVSAVYPDAF